jgi:hypothetical protein
MQKFDAIRPFYDSEVNEALQNVIHHPMMKGTTQKNAFNP